MSVKRRGEYKTKYIHTNINIHIHTCTLIHTYIYIYKHIFTHTYTHTHTHTHTYIYTQFRTVAVVPKVENSDGQRKKKPKGAGEVDVTELRGKVRGRQVRLAVG